MTTLQTFIKEQEERFDKLIQDQDMYFSIEDNDNLVKFHRQSLQDLLALIAEEVERMSYLAIKKDGGSKKVVEVKQIESLLRSSLKL